MIVYLDTSAFVKLVIDEEGAEAARRWFDDASFAACSLITYPEACAALSRRARRSSNADKLLKVWLAELDERWARTARVRVDERLAGRLAVEHSLRGMDAVHLAAATRARQDAHTVSQQTAVAVATFDRRLLEAAEREGFAILGGPSD